MRPQSGWTIKINYSILIFMLLLEKEFPVFYIRLLLLIFLLPLLIKFLQGLFI